LGPLRRSFFLGTAACLPLIILSEAKDPGKNASEGKTVDTSRREGSGIMVNEGGRCHMILKESIELLILLLQGEQSFSCVPFRWQGNWIRRGAKRPENPVTRFPAGRRGPRSGEGVLEGKNRKETQSRAGRLSAVRIAVECHIGAWPRTPYGPSRGSEGGRREIFESYSSCTIPTGPPLVAAPPPSPRKRWDNRMGESFGPFEPVAFAAISYCYLGPFPVYYTKVTHG
jgi:hypothetical protein